MPNPFKSNLASLSAFQNIRKVFKGHKIEYRNKWKDIWKQKFFIIIIIQVFCYRIYIQNFSPITKNLSQVFSPKPSI